ncbi:NAD(P)-binding protein [Aspergillus niger CBS 101883]|uniref:Contig An11c0220, genomic contig n=2 Tax=Aspergillus niger TaxID=5061 RepID=A2QWK1_ASPNC|nr:NAD(P)-binding protein [Aspergillus niger CBS 101883]XP_059601603.1 uncharacterized protein An11g05480 [Aspergillus niger]PYH56979.1 NAD(P)-binding protein [Aspergillus niger CBS 101883]CAK40705.1 unnamed protein product [Aspergillus niger]
MVKIAIAGGSGGVGREVIDALIAANKHEIIVLTRKPLQDAPANDLIQGITWVKADYNDIIQLTKVLQGVHTVLSFVTAQDDPTSTVQKNLIDAAVQAGVKRFAPSEWASSGLDYLDWYAYKGETRRYLHDLNKERKLTVNNQVLEYTLFQPGVFANYLTHPHQSARHLPTIGTPFDFANRRMILVDGDDKARLTWTAVQDLAGVVARAVDYEGEWPVVGGIQGANISVGQLIALGEKVRGGLPFTIERVKAQDLEAGTWETSWTPTVDHASIPPEQAAVASKYMTSRIILAADAGSYLVSDEWNRLLPDFKFTAIEEFLAEAWKGKA